MMAGRLRWTWLGRVAHAGAAALQERLRGRIIAGDDGAAALLLCEHEPVITLGRGADRAHVVAPGRTPVVRTGRGGGVTYHGPGQLMVYPVVRLRGGVVAYLEAVAGALAEVAAALGVAGAVWRRDPAGLWLGPRKLAACGIHVRRRVAIHGWALDVATPEAAWQQIVPCGLPGVDTVSIARAAGAAPPVAEVAELAAPMVGAALGASSVRRVTVGGLES